MSVWIIAPYLPDSMHSSFGGARHKNSTAHASLLRAFVDARSQILVGANQGRLLVGLPVFCYGLLSDS
jgi:hypothetical protein